MPHGDKDVLLSKDNLDYGIMVSCSGTGEPSGELGKCFLLFIRIHKTFSYQQIRRTS